MKLTRLILPASLALMLASCGYEPVDDGRAQEVIKDKSGKTFSFGGVEQVSGTRFFTLPIWLTDDVRSSGSFSGTYKGSEERNRLIVDSANGKSKRVLPDQNAEIVNWIIPTGRASDSNADYVEAVAAKVDGAPTADRTGAYYAAVVKRPAKEQEKPATYDVLLGQFESGQQQWIAQGLTSMESVWITPDGKLAMVAATTGGGVFRLYDPKSFRQLLETKLSI